MLFFLVFAPSDPVVQILLSTEVPGGGREDLLPAPQHSGHYAIPLTRLFVTRVTLDVTSMASHKTCQL